MNKTQEQVLEIAKNLEDELEKNIEEIKIIHRKKIILLQNTFARENAKYQIGDFLRTKTNVIIKVEKITGNIWIWGKQVSIIYHGPRYKKVNGVILPNKDKTYSDINQNSISKKITDGKFF